MNHLIAQYKQLLDLQDSRFSLIKHEDAMVAVVYKVTTASYREYVLKICSRHDDYLRESHFLKLFEEVKRSFRPKTKLLILNYLHNPT